MRNTREQILQTALRLFAQRGFEGVSVRDIAGALELTAPALYVHYRSKQELLEAILRRMEERDAELSNASAVPALPFSAASESYAKVKMDNLIAFTIKMFQYWTEDGFAVLFRHLLTVEQYRDSRFGDLFQQYLGGGVIRYLEDIFQGSFPKKDAHQLALAFYAPVYFLMGQYDGTPTKKGRAEILLCLQRHLREFATQFPLPEGDSAEHTE